MKFKSIAWPAPTGGTQIKGKKIVVPNQSLSLQEILERFTRGEPVAVGRDVQYHESEDDLEKISHMDLVDREEYVEKLKDTQKAFKAQEAKKVKLAREKVQAEFREKIEYDLKKAAEKAPKTESNT